MKIWLKYFIGIIIGSLAGVLLPFESETSQKILSFFFQFVIQFGRYMVVPVVFFSMTISVCKLREQRKLWSSVWKIGVFILGATLSLTIMGLVLGLIIKLPRIPISVEQTASAVP
ncbi:MAG: cation:dicarboxylase symporter family transporter [Spirochaetaceae bacterium]|nr:cation:dicarboxylase symporter family transporter [Spirochaetaceae bacterium]